MNVLKNEKKKIPFSECFPKTKNLNNKKNWPKKSVHAQDTFLLALTSFVVFRKYLFMSIIN